MWLAARDSGCTRRSQARQPDSVKVAGLVAVRDESADARAAQRGDGFAGPRRLRSRLAYVVLSLGERVYGSRYTDAEDRDDDERGEPRAHLTLIVQCANADVKVVVVIPEHLHDA